MLTANLFFQEICYEQVSEKRIDLVSKLPLTYEATAARSYAKRIIWIFRR